MLIQRFRHLFGAEHLNPQRFVRLSRMSDVSGYSIARERAKPAGLNHARSFRFSSKVIDCPLGMGA